MTGAIASVFFFNYYIYLFIYYGCLLGCFFSWLFLGKWHKLFVYFFQQTIMLQLINFAKCKVTTHYAT